MHNHEYLKLPCSSYSLWVEPRLIRVTIVIDWVYYYQLASDVAKYAQLLTSSNYAGDNFQLQRMDS